MNYIEKISRNKYFYLFLLLVLISTFLSILYSVTCITDFNADEHIYLEQVYTFAYGEELAGWKLRNFFFPIIVSLPIFVLRTVFGISDHMSMFVITRISYIIIVNGVMSASIFLFSRKILKDRHTYLWTALFLLFNPYWISSIGYFSIDPPIAAFVLLSAFFIFYSIRLDNNWHLIFSGLCIGAAYLIKYSGGVLFLLFLLVLVVYYYNKRTCLFKKASIFFSSFGLCVLFGGIIDYITWGSPFSSLYEFVMYNIINQSYVKYHTSYALEYVFIIFKIHWLLILTFFSIITILLLLKKNSKFGFSLLLIIFGYVLIMSFSGVRRFRYLWPIIPFLAILTANFISIHISSMRKSNSFSFQYNFVKYFFLSLALVFTLLALFADTFFFRRIFSVSFVSFVDSFAGFCLSCLISHYFILFFLILALFLILVYLAIKFWKLDYLTLLIIFFVLIILILSFISLEKQFSKKCSDKGCFSFFQDEDLLRANNIYYNNSDVDLLILYPCNMPSFYTKEYASTYHVRCPLITMDRLSELDNYSIVIFPNKILYTVCDELIRTYELKKDYFRINSSVFSAYIINRSE